MSLKWTLRGARELQDALNDRTADVEMTHNDVGGLGPDPSRQLRRVFVGLF
jgi:hypothetical protein